MEDLLILILQALGEFLFELFAWWPWDWFWYFGDYRWDGQYGPSRTTIVALRPQRQTVRTSRNSSAMASNDFDPMKRLP